MRRGCKSCKNNKRGGWSKVGQDAKIVKSLNEILYDEICKRKQYSRYLVCYRDENAYTGMPERIFARAVLEVYK